MKISLIHPSRGRAEIAYKAFMHWLLCSTMNSHIEHILSIDSDDEDLSKYKTLFQKSKIIISENKNLVEATNIAAKVCTGDIIILISDDMLCPDDWDLYLKEFHHNHKNYLLKTFDGVQKWIVTLPIMDRLFYESNGYIYHPDYKHMFCDTDLTHKADLEKKLIIRNDLEFTHAHYSVGKSVRDAINVKADATLQQGETIYLERCRNKFSLDKHINLFDLSAEGMQHIKWLNKKLQ